MSELTMLLVEAPHPPFHLRRTCGSCLLWCVLVTLSACAEPTLSPHGTHADDCAQCHPVQYGQWSLSAHARSDRSPVFVAMLPAVETAWGAAARDECVGCHSPRHGGDAGIGCVSCHGAIGNTGERDGRLLIDLGEGLSGPFEDPRPTAAHETRPGGFLASESLCGTCHEVTGPALFEEPTLTQYRDTRLGSIGTTCLDCHLPRTEGGPAAEGSERIRTLRSHRFIGLDPPWGAPPDVQTEAAEETRELLAIALDLWVVPTDSDSSFEVWLSNAGAGHHVPTGVSFLRDIWVDVQITHADGSVDRRRRVMELGSRMLQSDLEVGLPTEADHIEERGLQLGESRHVLVTAGGGSVVRLTATLRARAVRATTLHDLGLAHLEEQVPVHIVRESVITR